MWGTFILEAYVNGERAAMADALETICSSRDDYAFASGGVYCFWALDTRKPLYIGRAVDIPERFRQHNGLAGQGETGNKLAKINEHFGASVDDTPLGYSILVRSPLSQTTTGRRRSDLKKLEGWVEEPDSIDSEVEFEIAEAEAIAIRSYWFEYGALPPWNRIQGQATRASSSMQGADDTARVFCGMHDTLLLARRSIKQLASEDTHTEFEMDLHTARIEAVKRTMLANEQMSDHAILTALDSMPSWYDLQNADRIREQGYLQESPWVMGVTPDPWSQGLREGWTAGQALAPGPPAPPLRTDLSAN